MVQCLGLCASTEGGTGSGPSQGTKITAPQLGRRRFKQGYVANSQMQHKIRILLSEAQGQTKQGERTQDSGRECCELPGKSSHSSQYDAQASHEF